MNLKGCQSEDEYTEVKREKEGERIKKQEGKLHYVNSIKEEGSLLTKVTILFEVVSCIV